MCRSSISHATFTSVRLSDLRARFTTCEPARSACAMFLMQWESPAMVSPIEASRTAEKLCWANFCFSTASATSVAYCPMNHASSLEKYPFFAFTPVMTPMTLSWGSLMGTARNEWVRQWHCSS